MRTKIPPSQRKRNEIQGLLRNGITEGDFLSQIIKQAASLVLQEFLEQEASDYLGRDHYERKREGQQGYRNGYEPSRIKTAEGTITVQKPQIRDSLEPFHTKLGVFLKGNTDILDKLAVEMYARGLSTRDIEDTLIEATGELILSKTSVSQITEILYQEFENFQSRDLSEFDLEYLFIDALYESIRARFGVKEAVLCAWGITRSGEKVMLHLGLGNKESLESWQDFLYSMVRRGLRVPTTITTDGAPGLISAVESVFPLSLRIRCWFHRMKNLAAKVPEEAWTEVKAELMAIRSAAGYEQGRQMAATFIQEYKSEYPSLVKAFEDDLESLLNILKVPFNHRKNVRTTNLIERSFEEERRRTKVIPGFLTEKSALKLIFSVLIRASKRWQRVKFSPMTIEQLNMLRKELGIKDEPSIAFKKVS
jgi:putative transposase